MLSTIHLCDLTIYGVVVPCTLSSRSCEYIRIKGLLLKLKVPPLIVPVVSFVITKFDASVIEATCVDESLLVVGYALVLPSRPVPYIC